MDVRDWIKILSLVGGVVLIGIGATVGSAHATLLLTTGVGLVTAAGIKSTGVSGLVEKAKGSLRPGAP